MTKKRSFQNRVAFTDNYCVPIIFYVAVFIAGAGFSSLGAILPNIVDQLKLTTSAAAAIPFALFCGGISGLLVMGFSLQYAKPLLGGSILLMFGASLAIVLVPANLFFLKMAFFILLMIAGAVGASLVAESVGLAADTLGFSWGMGIAAIICAVILPLIYLLPKTGAAGIKP